MASKKESGGKTRSKDSSRDLELTRNMGLRLRAFRNVLGLTQGEVAEIMKTTQGVVTNLERGTSRIHPEYMMPMVDAFRMNPLYIYGLSNKMFLVKVEQKFDDLKSIVSGE